MPRGRGPHRVAVLVHGGSWQARFSKVVMRGLAGDLLRRGWAVWNLEYRRVGEGQDGGWPATFEDVAAGVDHLAAVADEARLDLERVLLVGHSAGGQLALWVGGPRRGGPGGPAVVRPCAVVAQAGVADMTRAWGGRGDSVDAVMGGGPREVPERYDAVDPVRQVPIDAPVLLVHGTEDATVGIARSRAYLTAARGAGGDAELVEVPGPAGGHRRHIDPRGPAWAAVVDWLARRQIGTVGSGPRAGSSMVRAAGS
ncbi:alpha/beta hydrolase family protein [Conexibacter sp. SYSU D00693]|uniref:alpha/beta hydrolase family protein n=1 Tax=Conexibacter sp. SYSU D00693 TaxID=2812560 RepID=UPI00353017C5